MTLYFDEPEQLALPLDAPDTAATAASGVARLSAVAEEQVVEDDIVAVSAEVRVEAVQVSVEVVEELAAPDETGAVPELVANTIEPPTTPPASVPERLELRDSPPLAVTTDHGRFYRMPGQSRVYPSVTTLIHQLHVPALERWRIKQAISFVVRYPDLVAKLVHKSPKEVQDLLIQKAYNNTTAADLGTRVHAYGEALARRMEPPLMEPSDAGYVKAISKFIREHCLEFLEVEVTVFSHKYGYAGTADAIIRDAEDGAICLIDYKTGRIYGSVAMQLNALLNADEIVYPDGTTKPIPHVDRLMAIQVRKGGSYAVYEASLDQRVFDTFVAYKKIWEFEQRDWVYRRAA